MAAELRAAGPAAHMSVTAGDGQYEITASQTALFVVRQQARGQHLLCYAFRIGDEVQLQFQFPQALTEGDHGILRELRTALHAARTLLAKPLPVAPDALLRMAEKAVDDQLAVFGGAA